jgi:hypothetical protein
VAFYPSKKTSTRPADNKLRCADPTGRGAAKKGSTKMQNAKNIMRLSHYGRRIPYATSAAPTKSSNTGRSNQKFQQPPPHLKTIRTDAQPQDETKRQLNSNAAQQQKPQ